MLSLMVMWRYETIPGLVLAHHPGMSFASLRLKPNRYFGCGTIRIYGFGAFQPAG